MTTPIGHAISRRGREWPDHEQARPVGDDVVDLSSEEIGGTTPDRLRADTIAALGQHLGDHYTRRPGMLSLCQAVADSLAERDIAVDVESGVIITGSIQEARSISLLAVAADKTIHLPRPSCASDYSAGVQLANSRVEYFDPTGVLPPLQKGVVLLPNPNPATGQLYAREMLERLAHWICDCDLLVISDETLAPLCRPELPMMYLAALPKMAERTLTLGSFAGIPGLDSWLVSWIAGPKSLVAPARGLKLGISLCSAAVSQHGALAGMLSGNERLAAQNVSRINAVKALLKQHGIPYLEPDTVAFLVADVSSLGGGDRVAAAGTRGGIRLTSGSEFGAPNCIRISAPSSRFEQGMARLESVLKSMEKD